MMYHHWHEIAAIIVVVLEYCLAVPLTARASSPAAALPGHAQTREIITVPSLPISHRQLEITEIVTPPATPAATSPHVQAAVTCTSPVLSLPAHVSIYTAPLGVSDERNAPVFYDVSGGASLVTLHQNLTACANHYPQLTGFHGLTQTTIEWTYYVTAVSDSQCRLDGVKVISRSAQLLPRVDTSSLNQTDRATWQREYDQLQAHENGHVSIVTHQAATLYQELIAMQEGCDQITSLASAYCQQALTENSRAHDTYDATTQHGLH